MKYLFVFLLSTAAAYGSLSAQVSPAHIVVVVLENRAYNQIVGNPLLPYINSILTDTHTAVLTKSFGLTHPSQPNYLQFFSGSDQGVTSNNLPVGIPFVTPNLGSELIKKGFGFTGYSEDLPSTGFNGQTSGEYARKHNPWVNWQASPTNGIPASQNKSFANFPTDFSTLPTVSFVVPNQNNDMHNGSVAVAFPLCDVWLQQNLNNYVQWCKSNNSIFIITFDEDDGSQGNQILTSITGEHIVGGNYNQPVTHYNILRTLEELYQLTYAGKSADSTAVQHIWNTVAVCKGSNIVLKSNLAGNVYQWQVNSGSGYSNISNNTNYSGATTSSLQINNVPSAWYGYKYRCVVDGARSNTKILNVIDYWRGAVSDVWEDPLNWSCGSLPDNNTDVIINNNRSLILNSSVSVRSIKLGAGANLTQKSNHKLTITH